MIELGLFPNLVTTRQIRVLLRPCHSRLIAPCAVSLWIFAQPCGRPGRWCSVGINSNFRSCGSVMIFSRNDPRPLVITWITVCITLSDSPVAHSFATFVWNPSHCSHVAVDVCVRLAQARLQKRTKHDVNIDISFLRMPKSTWQCADDLETELFPEANGSFVRRNDKVELHRAKAKPARLVQAMLTHFSADPKAARFWCDHERRIRNVRAKRRLIRSQNVSEEHTSELQSQSNIVC